MSKKTALIIGITGQDGSYLSELLISKGYNVKGIIRRASDLNTARIEGLIQKYEKEEDPDSTLELIYGDLTDASSIRNALEKFKPDEIYNLGAQSHVGISFVKPNTTFDINAGGTLRVLDAVRDMKLDCKYYQASSSEMFGISPPPQHEDTIMLPQSPYGTSKLAAYHLANLYRKAYGIFVSNGILFNHESPRRGLNFVTRKITLGIAKILTGEEKKITLGNLGATRDWGYAKEYVEAMWKILNHSEPDDFVISTEETHTIEEFLKEAFSLVDLNYKNFTETHQRFQRPAEVPHLLGDSSKAKRILGWSPKIKFKDLVHMMVEADIKKKFEEKGILPIEPGINREKGYYLEKAKELANKLKATV